MSIRACRSRYFMGNDGVEYQWKTTKTAGCIVSFVSEIAVSERVLIVEVQLTRAGSSEELARYIYTATDEGLYAGERKTRLRIQPTCSIDLDLVVLTFIIAEKKRRDAAGPDARLGRDEDPCGDGAGDGGGGA